MNLPEITGDLKKQLLELTLAGAPHEVVGVIYKGHAYTLENRSDQPEDSFNVSLMELRKLIENLRVTWDSLAAGDVAFWHSHPSGGIGPSRMDMRERTPLKYHLVVALVDGDIVPTWY